MSWIDTRVRTHPLCAALAAVLASAPFPAATLASPRPTIVLVANCNDSGPGSLREAAMSASDGDTIDLSQLGCSRISLTTGSIPIAIDSLTLIGPGRDALTIDGAYNSNQNLVFHLGHGTLSFSQLALTRGSKYRENLPALGGCVYSLGAVSLDDTAITDCTAHSTGEGNVARGGAIYATGDVTMIDSVVSGATALNTDEEARGGGIYTYGSLIAKYSTIADNYAMNLGNGSLAGGAFVNKQALVVNSTISGNRAWQVGAMFAGRGADYPVEIDNSTITDNIGVHGSWGGVFASAPTKIQNSTIAFNHTGTVNGPRGAGLHVASTSLDIESSIIANNTNEYDATSPYQLVLYSTIGSTLLGTNNLIVSANVALTPGTLTADPRLGPLRNNGGPTRTRMPMTGSPVIDAGNNVQGTNVDQRGGGYPRVIGAAPDIGALEFSSDDDIFWSGFEPR